MTSVASPHALRYTSIMKIQLREGRNVCELGGYGVNRQLRYMSNATDVFWTPRSNSYVVVASGETFKLVSINGIGEIRWTYDVPLPAYADSDARTAYDYFFEEVV